MLVAKSIYRFTIKTICFFVLLSFFPASAIPRDSKAMFRSKVIEEYEFDPGQYEVDPKTAERHLSQLTVEDQVGHMVQSWSFYSGVDASRYSHTDYTLNRRGDWTSESYFESSTGAPNLKFSVVYSQRGFSVTPTLDETLRSNTIHGHDRFGHRTESRTVDGQGKLIELITRKIDALGHPMGYRQIKGDGTLLCESNTTYSKNFLDSTQTFTKGSTPSVVKIVRQNDSMGREILEEQYSISKRTGKMFLDNRGVNSYSGDVTNFEWTFFNENGEIKGKSEIVFKNDREISRKEFSAESSSDGKSHWRLTQERTNEYTFDQNGNVIKEINWMRQSPDRSFKVIRAVERVVSYLQ